MTLVEKNLALAVTVAVALAAIAAGLAPAGTIQAAAIVPVIILLEFIIYAVLIALSSPKASITSISGGALLLLILRVLMSYVGYGIFLGLQTNEVSIEFTYPWSSLATVIAQIGILTFTGAFVVAGIAPALLTLGEDEAKKKAQEAKAQTSFESAPTGGFIQVYSYDELSAVIRKVQGLEGFILYSEEGLVVWRDLPLRVDGDTLIAQVQSQSGRLANIVENHGLAKVRRILVETREHLIFATTLEGGFGLLMVFSDRVTPSDVLTRIAVPVKTTNEFLQWKYENLPVVARSSREKVSLESVS